MEKLKQYMEKSFNETKLGILSQIESYLNHKYPNVKVTYISNNFIIPIMVKLMISCVTCNLHANYFCFTVIDRIRSRIHFRFNDKKSLCQLINSPLNTLNKNVINLLRGIPNEKTIITGCSNNVCSVWFSVCG